MKGRILAYKRAIASGLLAGSLFMSKPALSQESKIPEIPAGKYLMSVRPVPIGFLLEYDTDGDSYGDYRTLRLIKNVTPTGIALTKPWIYYIDFDRNRRYESKTGEVFIDEDMDGEDIQPYEQKEIKSRYETET